MPAARFWRLNVRASARLTQIALAEVAFLDPTFADVSVGGTAYASGTNGSVGTVGPAFAFDKNVNTYWNSNTPLPAAIWYDHGAAVDVVGVRIRGRPGEPFFVSAQEVSLAYSSDGITWSPELRLRLDGRGALEVGAYTDLVIWDGVIGATELVTTALFANSETPAQTVSTHSVGALYPWRDMEFAGKGFIAGTVKRDADPADVPLRRRVRLYREADGFMVRETWSDAATGAYRFDEINEAYRYTAIAYDHLHDYRAVVADNLTPEVAL